MEKVLQYAQFAEECRTLAANLTKPDYKKTLEVMARAWEAVAALIRLGVVQTFST